MKLRIDQLYTYIMSLKDKSDYAFLQNTILSLSLLNGFVKTCTILGPKEIKDAGLSLGLENGFFTKEGKLIYLHKNDWDKLYFILLKNYLIKEDDITSEDFFKVINNPKMHKLNHSIENLIKYFNDNNNPLKKYFNIVKLILKQEKIQEFLNNQLFTLIIKNKNKHTNNELYELPLVNTGVSLGKSLISFMFQTNKSLNDFYKSWGYQNNKKLVISVNIFVLKFMKDLLKAYIENDKDQLKEVFKDVLFVGSDNKHFINIMTLSAISLLYLPYKRHDIKDYDICLLLSKIDFKKINLEVTEIYLQIGVMILNFMIEENNVFKLIKENYHEDKQNKAHKIRVNEDVMEQLLDKHNINKPYLTQSNMDYLERVSKTDNDVLTTLAYEKYKNIVRPHFDLDLQIKSKSYLNENLPYVLQTIDRNYLIYLFDFLALITKEKKTTGLTQNTLEIILTFYDINLNDVIKILNNCVGKPNMLVVYALIIDYASNFNIISTEYISEKIKEFSLEHENIFKDLLNKISQNKITFINIFKESVLLFQFKYFFNNLFLDSRGRLYNGGIFTNIQLYPLAKCLIKPFISIHNENRLQHVYSFIKKDIKKHLYNQKIKEELDKINYTEYKRLENELMENYLYNFFKPTLSRENFQAFFMVKTENYTSLASIIAKHIKKEKLTLFVHSHIILLIEKKKDPDNIGNKFITNYYELDATASGLQMISIIFNEPTLAKYCNLIGNEIKDIYSYVAESYSKQHQMFLDFIKDFDLLQKADYEHLQENICTVIYKASTKQFFMKLKNENNFVLIETQKDKLKAFISMDITKSLGARQLTQDLLQMLTIYGLYYDNIIKWAFSVEEKKFIRFFLINKNNVYLLENLLQIKHLILYVNAINKNKGYAEIISQKTRELFKTQIMTYFYNSTSYSRKEDFHKFFREKIPSLKKNDKNLNVVCKTLESFFSNFMKKDLPVCFKVIELSKYLSNKHSAVRISNKNFNITFDPKKNDNIRIQTTTHKTNERGYQLTLHKQLEDTDPIKFAQKFSANFIHSADANIVHFFNERLLNINKTFSILGMNINFGSNHDTFWLTMAPLLKLILKDCYYEFYDSKYISSISIIDKELKEPLQEFPKDNDLKKSIEYVIFSSENNELKKLLKELSNDSRLEQPLREFIKDKNSEKLIKFLQDLSFKKYLQKCSEDYGYFDTWNDHFMK